MLPPSLKAIGRRKVRFHLDDLAYIGKDPATDEYFWVCLMAESTLRDDLQHVAGLGVSCGAYQHHLPSQAFTEERALEHLVNCHRAMGGERLPKGRGAKRREREREEWNERRRAELEDGEGNGVHRRSDGSHDHDRIATG